MKRTHMLIAPRRGSPLLVAVLSLAVISACAHPPIVTAPMARVADSTRARVILSGSGRTVEGRAIGWASAAPRLLPDSGAVIDVRCPDLLFISTGSTGHGFAGGIYGMLAGALLTVAECGGQSHCGEENPTGFLTTVAGVIIGNQRRDPVWSPVYRDGCGSAAPVTGNPPRTGA